MSNRHSQSCPDCQAAMKPIRMIDQQLSVHHPLVYSIPEAERGFWSSKYPVKGTLTGVMCEGCGLVKLYAEPTDA